MTIYSITGDTFYNPMKNRISMAQSDNTLEVVNECTNEFMTTVQKQIDYIQSIMTTDFDTLSDKDFAHKLSRLYSSAPDIEDILQIFSNRWNKKYTSAAFLETTMVDEQAQICYLCAVRENVTIDEKTVYTVKQLKEMLRKQDILLIYSFREDYTPNHQFKEEPIQHLAASYDWMHEGMGYDDEDAFPILVQAMREYCTKERILKDVYQLALDLQSSINLVLENASSQCIWKMISSSCSHWFYESKNNEKLDKLLMELQVLTNQKTKTIGTI